MQDIIQGLWIGDNISRLELLSLRSFVANGHPFHLYLYAPLPEIPAGVTVFDANEIIPYDEIQKTHGGSYAMFADKFRYKLLYLKGGWWVDLDIICLKPFEFESPHIFGLELEPDGDSKVGNAVLKVPPGSELIKACLDISSSVNIADLPWGATGPHLLTQLVQVMGLTECIQPYETFYPIHWWQMGQLLETGQHKPDLKKSYAVHLWNEYWRRNGLDKDANYPGSLYEAITEKL